MKVSGSIPMVIGNTEGLYQGDLIKYFQVIFGCAQNLPHPYHNFRHMLHITWQCHNACEFHRDELSRSQMRALLIAAMFHDFDHSGMTGCDDLNIERAVRGVEKHLLPEDDPLKSDIIHLVRATEFPYKIPHSELDLSGLIIRDADMTQALSPVWMQEVLFGLAAEWKKQPLDILRSQEGFLKQLKFHTRWAQETFTKDVIEAKIVECRQLLSLLEPCT